MSAHDARAREALARYIMRPPTRPATHRSHSRPWAELLKRPFEIDVLQCSCDDADDADDAEEWLKNQEWLTLEPPTRAPARDPPY